MADPADWDELHLELATLVRATWTDLPVGDAGVTRGVSNPIDLQPDRFPHVFIHSWTDTMTLLDWGQKETETRCQLELWTCGESQTQIMDRKFEFFREADGASPANVADQWKRLHFESAEVLEHSEGLLKAVIIVPVFLKVAF